MEKYSRRRGRRELGLEHRSESRVVAGENDTPELEGDSRGLPVYADYPAEALDTALLGRGSGEFKKDSSGLPDFGQSGRRLRLFEIKN
jgi:hypothetical protein